MDPEFKNLELNLFLMVTTGLSKMSPAQEDKDTMFEPSKIIVGPSRKSWCKSWIKANGNFVDLMWTL